MATAGRRGLAVCSRGYLPRVSVAADRANSTTKRVALTVFGGHGQVVVGVLFCAITVFQAWLWGIRAKPGSTAIFWLSIEALFFAAYAVVATGLGYRATERVEATVVENLESDETYINS